MAKKSPTSIDALYGLEPVFEPGSEAGTDALERFVELCCPYCGETYGVAIDLSGGPQNYVEDCQVCCQPISATIVVDEQGEFVSLQAERING